MSESSDRSSAVCTSHGSVRATPRQTAGFREWGGSRVVLKYADMIFTLKYADDLRNGVIYGEEEKQQQHSLETFFFFPIQPKLKKYTNK